MDGESFLELSEADIKEMVSKIGLIKKICRLQGKVNLSSAFYFLLKFILIPSVMQVTEHHDSTAASIGNPTASDYIANISTTESITYLSSSDSTANLSTTDSTFSRAQSPLSPLSCNSADDQTQFMNSDDNVSLSSASGLSNSFKILTLWRPTIMACTTAESVDEQKKLLTMSIRNEIVRDLVTQMFAFKPKPDRVFCGTVAKELVKKYPFMKDSGLTTSGYVSMPTSPLAALFLFFKGVSF